MNLSMEFRDLLNIFGYSVKDIPNIDDYEWDMILDRCINFNMGCEDEIYLVLNSDANNCEYFKSSYEIAEYLNCRHRDLTRFIIKNNMVGTDILNGHCYYGFTKLGCAKLFFKYRNATLESLEKLIGKLEL